MAAYWLLGRELKGKFEPELRAWRIDVATLSEYATQAADDIAAADVLIMALRASQPFSTALLRWAGKTSDGCCGVPRRALIAIVEETAAPAKAAESRKSPTHGELAQTRTDVILWSAAADAVTASCRAACSVLAVA